MTAPSPARTRRFALPRLPVLDVLVVLLVATLLALAIFAPFFAPESVYRSNIINSLLPPSAEHWLGTDAQGRDVLWRVLIGTRATLLSAAIAVSVYSVIGVTIATIATAGPRWLDGLLMRITDIFLSLPGMVVALGFAAALGPSLNSAIVAIGLTGWPITVRVLRGVMRETMEAPFVAGAQVLGVSRWRLMTSHVLPNSLDVLIVKWAGDISHTVLILAGLSFIGVGAQPPSAEWGAMIADSRSFISSAWWTAVTPGIAIVITSVAFGLLGDMLQARRDPTLHGS